MGKGPPGEGRDADVRGEQTQGYEAKRVRGMKGVSHSRYVHSTCLSRSDSLLTSLPSSRTPIPPPFLYPSDRRKLGPAGVSDGVVASAECELEV